jgi:hypothetical protein
MTDHLTPHHFSQDPLDRLVAQLLDCGGVLSQLIQGMLDWEAEHPPPPDAVPIPETAHKLVRGALDDVRKQFSRGQVGTAARIVELATELIANNIFVVSPEFIKELEALE